MRILCMFVDMFRCDSVNSYNKDISNTIFDDVIRKIGGTVFDNVYTSGADTARSLAQFWTGVPCYENGCTKRAHYPMFFLEKESFVEVLQDNGYSVHLFAHPNEVNCGIFPKKILDKAVISNEFDLKKFIVDNDFSSPNEFFFIDIDDYHSAIDDYGPGDNGINKAIEQTVKSISIAIDNLDIDSFDEVIIFSDHGMLKYGEARSNGGIYNVILSDRRSKVLTFIHKKGDTGLSVNNRFSSMSDFYPHILNNCNIAFNQDIDGIDFDSQLQHEYIISEDFYIMKSDLHMDVEVWSVRTNNGLFVYSFGNEPIVTGNMNVDCKRILSDNCPEFRETNKVFEVLQYYDRLKDIPLGEKYVSGDYRVHLSKSKKINAIKQRLFNRYFGR